MAEVPAEVVRAVEQAMIEHGPDGHTDGAEEIAEAAIRAWVEVRPHAQRACGVLDCPRPVFTPPYCEPHRCCWGECPERGEVTGEMGVLLCPPHLRAYAAQQKASE